MRPQFRDEKHPLECIWIFPKIEVPQNGWFTMENPIKMDDLGVPPFSETSINLINNGINYQPQLV